MWNRSAPRASTARAGRRRFLLAALAVLLLLAGAGLFTYSRLTAGSGHHFGDTITYTMPDSGTVAFTLRTVSSLGDAAAPPTTRNYTALMLIVNHTAGLLNITSAQFAAGPTATDSQTFAPVPSCAQEIPPGDNLTCNLTFNLPQDITQPVLHWLPDGAGNTANVWWYLTS